MKDFKALQDSAYKAGALDEKDEGICCIIIAVQANVKDASATM